MIKQMFSTIPKKRTSISSQSDANNEGGVSNHNNYTGVSQNSTLNETLVSNEVPITVENGSCSSRVIKRKKSDPLTVDGMPYCALPTFHEVPSSNIPNLFLKKTQMCRVLFDFTDPLENVEEKDIKTQTLNELVQYITSVTSKFDEVAMQLIIQMVAANLFRTFPPSYGENKLPGAYNAEEEEHIMDPAWPHLEIVYECLLKFVTSTETDYKLAKKYIDQKFLMRFLNLFESKDKREREYLKFILHRIYGKFMVHRSFIRKGIHYLFYRFIFETEKPTGIAELLEFSGSVINGFATPLKEEHQMFLVRGLILLHKPKCVAMYHRQLSYCIMQFVEKDSKLADTVIRGLLKYWPVTNSQKELLFLRELEEVLGKTQGAEFQQCMVPLFRQIGRCVNSSHSQVAERTIFLCNNDHIRNLITQNRQVILPIILPALEENTRNHWNQAVRILTLNVKMIFSDADQTL